MSTVATPVLQSATANGRLTTSPNSETNARVGAAPVIRLALAEHSEVTAHASAVARPKKIAVTTAR